MSRIAINIATASIAACMVAIIASLSMTGRWPGHAGIEHFGPNGLIATPPAEVARVEATTRGGQTVFQRVAGGWSPAGYQTDASAAELSKNIDAALHFLNVSPSMRFLSPSEYSPADLSSFGLDPPELTVALIGQKGELARVAFGAINPASTSQYVAVAGRPGVYMLSRYVGGEWRLAVERAARLAQGSLLLPLPIADIWAVEIVAQGQLTRFERDNAGLWFHHFGQHVHVSLADAHVADPVRAPLIATELDALDDARAQKVAPTDTSGNADQDLERYGLARPPFILLLYARDNSSPAARIEFGGMTADDTRQYARDRLGIEIIIIDSKESEHLRRLLQLAIEPRS
ncbi:MAG: DUF4340 domain-containing protein [Acetobacteraceae bacterium]|nr:DUF4340 domain-containing protein [Acetobacteraceae bacterium]